MDAESLRSPLGSECQDEWGREVWMDGETDERLNEDLSAPHVQEEELQQHTESVKLSGDTTEDFPSSGPAGETNSSRERPAGDQDWPPAPPPADQPQEKLSDLHSESPEGSDSIIFLSEDSEELSIDSSSLDLTSCRQQWAQRDSSSSKPPTPACSRTSSRSLLTEQPPVHTHTPDTHLQQETHTHLPDTQQHEKETHTHQQEEEPHTHLPDTQQHEKETHTHQQEETHTHQQEETHTHQQEETHTHQQEETHTHQQEETHTHQQEEPHTHQQEETHTHQQEEPHTHQQEETHTQSPAPHSHNQEVTQVCTPAPPLETVADKQAANREPGGLTCGAAVVKECVSESAGGWRRVEREREQTERERKQTEGERKQRSSCLRESESADLEWRCADAQRSRRETSMDVDQCEDSQSDSGVSADLSSTSAASSSAPPDHSETPIEREIRLAVRREQSLRRSRGLEAPVNREEEFVEIPVRRSILSQELPLKNEGKDRQFAGQKMQREIRAEVEREKVLVQLGRLPGFYDKGTVRQLREKKLLFEVFQEPRETLQLLNKRPASCDVTETDGSSGLWRDRSRSLELLVQDSNGNPTAVNLDGGFIWTSSEPHGPGLVEGTKGQVIILETTPSPAHTPVHTSAHTSAHTPVQLDGSGRSFSVKPYAAGRVQNQEDCCADEDEDDEDDDDGESPVMKNNPFFKLRSSLSSQPDVQQDIQQSRERERELRKLRTSIYGPGSADPTPTQTNPTSTQTNPTSTQTNPTSTQTNPTSSSPEPQGRILIRSSATAVRQSLGKLDLTWPPAPPQPEPQVQSETQRSQKRSRSVLLQRWENSLNNGLHQD